MSCTTWHECACTTLSVMTIVPKATVEMVQRLYDAKWSLCKAYPWYIGDKLFDAASYTHTR
jgi:hypothetical protein